jgi:GT2 family glycosyltransferase
MLKLSIIIVNWNGLGAIEDCLNSIYTNIRISFEVIVIDNNSSDESVRIIREKFPQVKLLQEIRNTGFSRANNKGFSISSGEYILILNPDTVVLKDGVDRMIEFLSDHEEIGILGPKMFEKNGSVSSLAKRKLPNIPEDVEFLFLINRIKKKIRSVLKISDYNVYFDKSEECECLTGTCMLFRRSDFERLGGFDESVPMYLDDDDICYRNRSNGLKNFYFAEAAILHLHQYSTKKARNYKLYDVLGIQARLFYYKKHFGPKKALLFKILILLSIPYLLSLDFFTAPAFLYHNKKAELGWIIKKHLKYFEIVFSDKIQFDVLK